MTDAIKTVNSVEHAARLLLMMGKEGEVGVSDLARGLKLPRATVYRLLKTLIVFDLVKQNGTSYRLGYGLLELASQVPGLPMVEQRIVPLLRDLTARTGETSHFAVMDGSSVTYLAKVDSPHPIRMFSYTGWRGPLHATGVGKAVLAFSSEDTIRKFIDAGLQPITTHTIVDPHELRRDLDQVRIKGFSIDDGELLDGLYCLAVPVLTHDRCVGAVSVAGPRERMVAGTRHLDEVRSTASEIAKLF